MRVCRLAKLEIKSVGAISAGTFYHDSYKNQSKTSLRQSFTFASLTRWAVKKLQFFDSFLTFECDV